AMAANAQGKFWEMYDLLFNSQGRINTQDPNPDLERIATEAGLDLNQFKSAMQSHRFKAEVTADMNHAAAVGAEGTPTFFVNGRKVNGAMPLETFKAAIDEETAKADELLKNGVKPEDLYAAVMKRAKVAVPR